MSEKPVLVGQVRSEFGKGAARRARRDGLVPVSVYGKGQETLHVDVPGHELFLAVRDHRQDLVDVVVDGTTYTVVMREVQRHPVSRVLLHVDFVIA
ncbi:MULTISPECIES: hypothetical protein [unclassified Schaalia]|uniref:hypothetical protein n=1 Tax=unclassified Schaalia TaxID=2691889 RepID=UPI001E646621|nr:MULTISPECIES: hypothetical protein [unclassified Schaalia]MCD4549070.1 hypothetical protein [Schaalia sp. lx-260]MCD4557258.1 hypothetical protein [Schaalia sp. lx-100]